MYFSESNACQNFLPKLKGHLFSQLEELVRTKTNTDAILQHDKIFFKNNMLYQHNIMRINYTTYDVRRAQDTINPKRDNRDIMLLSTNYETRDPAAQHQYQYARVIGIFHVNLIYSEPATHRYQTQRMEFLWVRYFEHIHNVPVQKGWSTARLDRLRFRRIDRDDAFGFLDPQQVIRACHIIPRFYSERLHSDGKGLSRCADDGNDWHAYYVNRYVTFYFSYRISRV